MPDPKSVKANKQWMKQAIAHELVEVLGADIALIDPERWRPQPSVQRIVYPPHPAFDDPPPLNPLTPAEDYDHRREVWVELSSSAGEFFQRTVVEDTYTVSKTASAGYNANWRGLVEEGVEVQLEEYRVIFLDDQWAIIAKPQLLPPKFPDGVDPVPNYELLRRWNVWWELSRETKLGMFLARRMSQVTWELKPEVILP